MRKIHQPSPEIPSIALPHQTTCVATCRSELWTLLCPKVMQLTKNKLNTLKKKRTTGESEVNLWIYAVWVNAMDRHTDVFKNADLTLHLVILTLSTITTQQPKSTNKINISYNIITANVSIISSAQKWCQFQNRADTHSKPWKHLNYIYPVQLWYSLLLYKKLGCLIILATYNRVGLDLPYF